MKILVNAHKCEIEKSPVNEKEINITKVEFEFSEEITNEYVKDVYFTLDNKTIQMPNIQNNECDIPYEVLAYKGQIEIGVVAYLLENDEYVKRYNPSPVYIQSWIGSLKEKYDNTEEITPSDKEQLEQELNDGLQEISEAVSTITTAVEQANTLDLDVSKSGKIATVELTKKDGTVKTVTLSDGTNLEFNWNGTSLGIKTDEDADYTYVDLQGVQGEQGPMGAPFTIKKTYSSVAEMNADFNNMNVGDYVMITSTIEVEDNAKLYCKGTEAWIFITDFSGATGIQGPTGATPNIQIGAVTTGETSSVTRSGTNENPVLNFVLEKGETGATGQTGATGNGIASITKTSEVGAVSTYRITFTDNTHFDYEVENGEVTQTQLDELQTRLDHCKKISNALPSVTGTGTSVTLNNSVNSPIKIELEPSELSQKTTTGKNLCYQTIATSSKTSLMFYFDKINNSDIVLSFTPTEALSGNSIYLHIDGTSQGIVRYATATANVYSHFPISFTNEQLQAIQNSNECYLLLYKSGANFVDIDDAQIEIGTVGTDFEEFTGGLPSPSPSYPQDVHVITGNNTIKIQNKNLLDKTLIQSTNTGNWVVEQTTTGVKITHNNSYSTGIPTLTIQLKPNTTYTYSQTVTASSGSPGMSILPDGGTTQYLTTGSITITTGSLGTIKLTYGTSQSSGVICNFDNMQLEENTSATTYTSHQEQSLSLTLGDLEYCKIGDYSDKFFKNTIDSEEYDSTLDINKWYLKKNIGKVILDGSNDENYTLSSVSTQTSTINGGNILPNGKAINSNKAICSHFRMLYGDTSDTEHARTANNSYPNNVVFYISKDKADDVSKFRLWLSDHDVIVYYVLETPTYTLLGDTLQTELDNIAYALSYDTQTNISQTNADLPFVIKYKTITDIASSDISNWNNKQEALVSGTNIKTINNQSILGSGNISISGGGSSTDVQINGTSIVSNDVANIVTEGTYNASTNKIATMSDLPSVSDKLDTNKVKTIYSTTSGDVYDVTYINTTVGNIETLLGGI